MGKYIQYGCGLSAPEKWTNFDSSPTLRIQRTPILSSILKSKLGTTFPKNVKYGDIVKGLPLEENSCDGVYCSHVLEHLSLDDFRVAIANTHKVLKPGGKFRMVMPNLEILINSYIENKKNSKTDAALKFIKDTHMGMDSRARGIKASIVSNLGNSKHLWLWDYESAIPEFEKAGFKNIRKCEFNDSKDEMFKLVESKERFIGAIALEMNK
jgi:predicted SAM-dependent methyltransferase